jgi:hypothetical protein
MAMSFECFVGGESSVGDDEGQYFGSVQHPGGCGQHRWGGQFQAGEPFGENA